jgi:hypothetical protein
MKFKARIFIYCLVGIPIPLLVVILYKDYFSSLIFFSLVACLGVMIEVIYKLQEK